MIKIQRVIDITGQKFGRLTVLKQVENYVSPKGHTASRWLCKCECGNETIVTKSGLRNGTTKSCGCLNKEQREINGKKMIDKCKKYNTYDLTGEYGIGYTSNTNKPFYFDLEDYDKIKDSCWYENARGYIASGSPKTYLHRFIMDCPKDKVVDHINGDKHNNKKSNLRICLQKENTKNVSLPKNNKSGVSGVRFRANKWDSTITVDNIPIFLGRFENFEDAVKARKEAEEKYFGEFSYDNSRKKRELNDC